MLGYKDFDGYLDRLDRAWVQSRGRYMRPLTRRAKAYRLARCANLLGCGSVEEFADTLASRAEVERLVDVAHDGRKPSAARQLLLAAREFADRECSESAFRASDVPGMGPQPLVEVLDDDYVKTLLTGAKAQDLRWWAFLSFLDETGRRVGEALSLRWDWFRLDSQPPHIDLEVTKGGRQQYVPLTTFLCEEVFTPANINALKVQRFRRVSRDPAVFPFPWAYSSALERLHELQDRLGLERRGFHAFRHTWATEKLAQGVPIHAVSALMGHATVSTTDRVYNHATSLAYANYVD